MNPIYLKAKAGEHISTTDVAKLIRLALKKAFPSTTFSVRSNSYSGGSSVYVSWMDGPTSKAVDAIVGNFETKGFDGMIDMAHYRSLWLAPDGSATCAHDTGTQGSMGSAPEHIGSAHHPDAVLVDNICGCYVQTSRCVSEATLRRGIEAVKAKNYSDLSTFDWSTVGVRVSSYDGSASVTGCDSVRLYNDWLSSLIHREAFALTGE